MFKRLAKLYQTLAAVTILLLLVGTFLFATMQTKWAKSKLKEHLIGFAKNHGIELTIGSFEGRLPFKWSLAAVHAKLPSGDEIDAEGIKLRLAFFPLLKKAISIDYLSIQNLYYTRAPLPFNTTPLPIQQGWEDKAHGIETRLKDLLEEVPYSIAIKTLKIPSLHLVNRTDLESADFSVEASVKIKRHFKRFFLHINIASPQFPGSHGTFFCDGNKRQNHVNVGFYLKMKNLHPFTPFVSPPFDADFSVQSSIEGPWTTWQALLGTATTTSSQPLQGHLKLSWDRLEIPNVEIANQKGKSDATFFVTPDCVLDVSQWVVTTPLIHLNAQSAFDLKTKQLSLHTAFSLPDLKLWVSPRGTPLFPLSGGLRGELNYNNTHASLEWISEETKVGAHTFNSVLGKLSASRENPNQNWEGLFHLLAKSTPLTLEGQTQFKFTPFSFLDLQEIALQGPDAMLSGHLQLNIPEMSLEGILGVHASDLSHFDLLTSRANLEGSLGGECRFSRVSGQKNGATSLDFQCQVSGLNYANMRAQEIQLKGTLFDIFGHSMESLQGSFSLEGERTYFPDLFLSSYSLNTRWEHQKWPFHLEAKGRLKDSLDIAITGTFQQERDLTALDIHSFSGHLLNKPFRLLSPTKFQWEKERFQLEDFSCRVDEGFVSIDTDLSPMRSRAKIKAEHIPIDLLSLIYPDFSMQGTIAIDGGLKATQNEIQGHLDVVLERAKIPLTFETQATKKDKPIAQAKGTLQAHLDNNVLQVQADLKATEDQFFHWTASLPLNYTPFPFSLSVSEDKPLASELIFEGKLEEVFDFINSGNYRLTGLLGAHVFLSKTLKSPALQGSISLSGGGYENDYTGTALKNINAEAIAHSNLLELTQFSATDAGTGRVDATGKLTFNPKENFPYAIHAELNDLNCVNFDLLTTNLSGPFEITGNTNSALAKGNLSISKATIRIPDNLPLELPQLPVTYVNFPDQRESDNSTAPAALFPLTLEIDLSASDHVYVKGKGLDSEWEGAATVKGTNENIGATGHLSLLKGKFSFAGKDFDLTKGEITFSDKANQQALISLSGTAMLPSMTITAELNGPLTSPQLFFSSVPQMPTSSILAHVLFNKDISEISPMQAIQLAQTIMTISGSGGTDVLEAIRKTIGVDRLNISTKGDSNEIAVQIGKYLTKGVMVTLAQSADSSQIVVEVELKHGFVLQAETQENQEGKFSLKWNKNY